ncbi:MAG: DUF1573 domain-containing protein [Thermoanaerobaculia bacterium]|nr:DUF1573 domain-containing protein [Thermoanaerobaculia bacterium]
MTPEEFGTVNVRRGDRAREIEVIRQQYRRHREALASMIADAPTEHLGSEYRRLVAEIDASMRKLDELEGRGEGVAPPPPLPPTPPKTNFTDTQPVIKVKTEPGKRPLVTTPELDRIPEEAPTQARTRIAAILLAGIAVLVVIGWLLWRTSSNRPPAAQIVTEKPASTATVVEEPPPPPRAAPLSMEPATQDFGRIRKGTRAVRQFEITNNTGEPVSIEVARSTCRCLFYDYAPVVPPRGKETISVTVDGVRAKSGALKEALSVSSKSDPSIAATVTVTATIK